MLRLFVKFTNDWENGISRLQVGIFPDFLSIYLEKCWMVKTGTFLLTSTAQQTHSTNKEKEPPRIENSWNHSRHKKNRQEKKDKRAMTKLKSKQLDLHKSPANAEITRVQVQNQNPFRRDSTCSNDDDDNVECWRWWRKTNNWEGTPKVDKLEFENHESFNNRKIGKSFNHLHPLLLQLTFD